MIDHERRRELAQQLRWLECHRIDFESFEDYLIDSGCDRSEDTTVAAIAGWASWGVGVDLTGPSVSDDEARRAVVVRAIVMLRSGSEYRWPKLKPSRTAAFFGLTEAAGWLCAVAMAVVGVFAWLNNVAWVGAALLGPKLLTIAATLGKVAMGAGEVRRCAMKPLERAWRAHGDVTAWPFLSQEELDAASQRGHLLSPVVPLR